MHLRYNNQSLSDLSSFTYEFEDDIAQITELDFSNNNLSDLPDWFEELVNLKKLSLENNRFNRFPEVIQKLTNLEELILSCNNIDSVPDWIHNLSKLERLELRSNRIKELPNALLECRELAQLDLSFNRIDELPDSVSKLIKLKWLRLNNNYISSLPEKLMSLPALTSISLHGNFQLEKLVDGVMKLNSNLKAKTIIQAILDRQDDGRLRAQPPGIRHFVSYRALGHSYDPHNSSFRYELNRLLQNPIQGNQRYNWVLMPHEVNTLEELKKTYEANIAKIPYANKTPNEKQQIGPLMVILTWNAEDQEVVLANDMLKWAAAEKIPYFVYTLTESTKELKLLVQRFRDEAVGIKSIEDCALKMFKRYEDYSDQLLFGDLAKPTDIRYQLVLKKLRLQNIAHFEDISLAFDRNMTCIVGRNGAGKSSLLKAITVAILVDQDLSVRTLFRDYDLYVSYLYRILETRAGGERIFAEKGKMELTYSLELVWNEKNVAKEPMAATEEAEILPTYRIELAYSSIDGKPFIDQFNVVDVGKEQAQMDKQSTSSSDDWADQYLGGPVQPIFYKGTMNLKSLVVTVAQLVHKYNPLEKPKPVETKPSIEDVKPLIIEKNDLHLERFVQWLINKYEDTAYGQAHAKAVFELINIVLYYEEKDEDDPQAVQAEDENKWLLEYMGYYQLNPAELILKTPTNPNGIQLEKSSQGIHHQLGWMGHLIRRLSEQHPHDVNGLQRRLADILEAHPDDDMETRRKRTVKVFEEDLHDYMETLRKRSAVVIIDEIDQSLHPHWQARMLYDLTQVFPNIQFIVTAHSPLCLAGLNREQVCIIDQKEVKPCPVDLWALWADEILGKVYGEKAPKPTKDIKEIKQKVEELMALLEEEKEKLEKMRLEGQDTSKQEEYVKKITQDLENSEEQDRGFTFSQIYQPGYVDNWREYIDLAKVERMKLSELVKKYQEKLKSIAESQPTNS